jgi:hypothetical protein
VTGGFARARLRRAELPNHVNDFALVDVKRTATTLIMGRVAGDTLEIRHRQPEIDGAGKKAHSHKLGRVSGSHGEFLAPAYCYCTLISVVSDYGDLRVPKCPDAVTLGATGRGDDTSDWALLTG